MKKDKYLQIFNYLLDFSKLRSTPVLDIENSDQYTEVVWLANIPQVEIFDCVTFPTYNRDSDYWIKMSKPKDEPHYPQFPELTKSLSEWVDYESLKDEDETPVLKNKIERKGKVIYLVDHPNIEEEFSVYINEKWIDDLYLFKNDLARYEEQCVEYKQKSDLYKQFFSIFNKAQQFADEYELIFGVGLNYFQGSTNKHPICRHLITSQVEIEFNENTFAIKVFPSIEAELKIESDYLAGIFGDGSQNDIIDAERLAKKIIEQNEESNPFSKITKLAINGFSERFHYQGSFIDNIQKPKEIPDKPAIYFTPALILRKRDTRSFTAVYEKIIQDLNESEDSINISSINDFIEDVKNNAGSNSLATGILGNDTIYFPKKYNDEQIEIVKKLQINNKVLVQGPPGTGKSHTIANLICHLLANGNKILVTAQTKRALEVLKDKLPDSFKGLAVSLLSGDTSSNKDLEYSVNAINKELTIRDNPKELKQKIDDNVAELDLLREQKAFTRNEWLKVKEKSTRQVIVNSNYRGTLIQIAEKLEKDKADFTWYNDGFADIERGDLISELFNFYEQTHYYKDIDCNEFDLTIPQKDRLLTIEELKEYKVIVEELKTKLPGDSEIPEISCNSFDELKILLQDFKEYCSEIESNISPFKSQIIADYNFNLFSWKDKVKRASEILKTLPENILRDLDRNVRIDYPADKDIVSIKSDAEFILGLLKAGKKVTGPFSVFNLFSNPNIKQRKYFIKAVQVNNNDCDTLVLS
jgi:DNA polymerase III delta prime subunit